MIFNNHIVQRIEWEKGLDKLQYGALCEIEWWIWHVTQAARVGRRRALSLVPHTPLTFPTTAAPVAHTASPWLVHQALDYLTTRGVLYQNTWAGSNTQKTCVLAQKGKSNTQILNSRMQIFSHHLKYQYNSPKCSRKKNKNQQCPLLKSFQWLCCQQSVPVIQACLQIDDFKAS